MSSLNANNIFNTTAKNFTKLVAGRGWENIHPVPNLAQADRCRPYHVVVKKNKVFAWNRVRYFPTSFTLSDIVPDLTEQELTSEYLADFDGKLEFEIGGKVSVFSKLARFFSGAKADAHVNVDLGKVSRRSLNIPDVVQEDLKGRKIDVNHTLINQARCNKRFTLCMVVTSYNTDENSSLSTYVSAAGGAGLKVDMVPDTKVDAAASMKYDKKSNLNVPKDTPIAYRLVEIHIGADGDIELKYIPGDEGGFETREAPTISPESTITIRRIPEPSYLDIDVDLRPLLSVPPGTLASFRSSCQRLLKDHRIILGNMNILCREATARLLMNESKETSTETLKTEISCEDPEIFQACRDILQIAGFLYEGEVVKYPTSDESDILDCISALVDLLTDLTKEQSGILCNCTKEEKSLLVDMLAHALTARSVSLGDPNVTNLFTKCDCAEFLIFSLGFQLEHQIGSGEWLLKKGDPIEEDAVKPEEMLVLMTALWDLSE